MLEPDINSNCNLEQAYNKFQICLFVEVGYSNSRTKRLISSTTAINFSLWQILALV